MRNGEKHTATMPTPRSIKRACNRELYRTVKRMNIYVSPENQAAAEDLYYKKVIENLIYIFENRDNKKKQADWWEEQVAPGIAKLWEVDEGILVRAFRNGYGA